MDKLGVLGAITKRKEPTPKGKMSKLNFTYVEEWDVVMCPQGHSMEYKTTTRQGYLEYHSNKDVCINCPKKEKCLYEKSKKRIIRLHVWDKHLREIDQFTKKTDLGKRIYKRRKETIERAFADLKELHGFRYARFRDLKENPYENGNLN
ncbi:Transposase DDE domain-containing protein [Dethiosulfatibacter aminovorans DSM 17477]|uniref:Transposase DDE domain-containing protein n=1 Tax=Dethiosulfatibacter aminovorans DSM 17477 TaxID=1121476 RepID=A0A1M6AUV2_9FIRM|nr:Transposase DDE domain-containing protein [Dethiosulfatibacter aminovorans DSM 17477]